MKKLGTLLLSALVVSAITGCEVSGPSVRLKPPVTVETGGHRGNGDFCPPGQAKKGNC